MALLATKLIRYSSEKDLDSHVIIYVLYILYIYIYMYITHTRYVLATFILKLL